MSYSLRPGRIWFLPNGSHLCTYDGWRLFGTAGDEFGRKTWWLHLGFGVLVVASKGVVYHHPENESLQSIIPGSDDD